MTDLFYGFGHLCLKFFKVLPHIGNKYNFFMIVLGFIGLFIWLYLQHNYTKTARKNGTLE